MPKTSRNLDPEQNPVTDNNMPSPKHLVITVHGIRTFGQWQSRLERMLGKKEVLISVSNYTYGYFSILAFLIPFTRWLVTLRFQHRLQTLIQGGNWGRIDIVAHSFGTHLVGWALHRMKTTQRPKIDTIILSGSVLKPGFPWEDLLGTCVGRLVNECGTKDSILVLNQICVLFTGMAGRVGFQGMTNENFRNRYHKFGHSGYFLRDGAPSDEFMENKWVPLLTSDIRIPDIDERGQPSALQGFLIFALNNAEPIKLTLYLIPFLFLMLWIFAQWQGAVSTTLANESINIREHEPDLALLLSEKAYMQQDNDQTRNALMINLQNARWMKSYLPGHAMDVSAIAFSPDGSLLASVQELVGKKLILWETDTLRQVYIHPKEDTNSYGITLVSADGYKKVAFSQDGKDIILWTQNEIEVIKAVSGDSIAGFGYSRAAAFYTANQQRAYVGGGYTIIEGYNPRGMSYRLYRWPDEYMEDLFFTNDGEYLVGYNDRKIFLQDFKWQSLGDERDTPMWNLPPAIQIPYGASKLAVDPKRRFIGGVNKSALMIWDFNSGKLLHRSLTAHELLNENIAFWPGRDLVLTCGGGGSTGGHSISVWNAKSGKYLGPLLVGFEKATTSLAFSQNGRYLASGDKSGKLILWDFSTKANPHFSSPFMLCADTVLQIAVNPAKPVLAVLTCKRGLEFFDYEANNSLAKLQYLQNRNIVSVLYEPTGKKLYIASSDGTISVWDTESYRLVESKRVVNGEEIQSVTMDPAGSKLAMVNQTGRIILVDAKSLVSLDQHIVHKDFGEIKVAFYPKGSYIFSAGANFFYTWDVQTGRPLVRLLSVGTSEIIPNADGKRLALLTGFKVDFLDEEGIRVATTTDTASFGKFVFTPNVIVLKGHTEPITAGAFSPDGRYFATSSLILPPVERPDVKDLEEVLLPQPRQSIFLRSGTTGAQIGSPLTISGSLIKQLQFSYDSKKLISLSVTGDITIWDVDPKLLAVRARRIANREFTPSETKRYLEYESTIYRILDSIRRFMFVIF